MLVPYLIRRNRLGSKSCFVEPRFGSLAPSVHVSRTTTLRLLMLEALPNRLTLWIIYILRYLYAHAANRRLAKWRSCFRRLFCVIESWFRNQHCGENATFAKRQNVPSICTNLQEILANFRWNNLQQTFLNATLLCDDSLHLSSRKKL